MRGRNSLRLDRLLKIAGCLTGSLLLCGAASCGKGVSAVSSPAAPGVISVKQACVPPQGAANVPWDLQAASVSGIVTVQWRGRSLGDYDIDGSVGVADITPIAMNYGKEALYAGGIPVEAGDNEYLACVDGDGNGFIGVSDITPIAQRFGERCAGYRVYLGLRAAGETEFMWDASHITPPGNPSLPVSMPLNTSRAAGEVQRYSFSFGVPSGFEGTGKVRIAASDGATDGAAADSDEFAVSTVTDTAPPYHLSGIAGLAAAAKAGRVLLSWGVWEDEQSPPVDIEIAWSAPPLEPSGAGDRITLEASGQSYEVSGLVNGQEYEFSCRFLDRATPPNATEWLPVVSATPSARLYELPAAGAWKVSQEAGISPSIDAFADTATAIHDAYAPVVAYIGAAGVESGQLFFARYDEGAWAIEAVSEGTFSACSIHAAGEIPVIIAARQTPELTLMRFWNDEELGGWNSEAVYGGAATNLKTHPNTASPEYPYAVFNAAGASPQLHIVHWGGSEWLDSAHATGFSNSVLDISLTAMGSDSLQILVTHGTANAAQAQIDSSIACYAWDISSRAWSLNGDWPITDDGLGNPRSAFNTTFWQESSAPPSFLGSAGVIRVVNQTIFTYNVDVPYGDTLGMEPGCFGAQPQWVEIKKGTTGINLMPLGLTLNWFIEPRWAEGADSIVFVNVQGTVTFTLNPFTVTGGTLTPTWWTATRDGTSWSSSLLRVNSLPPPGGRAQDMAPSTTQDGFQMAYTQVDTIDVESLLGGGELPAGQIYYARK